MLGTYLSLVFAIVLISSLYSLSSKLQLFSDKSAAGRYSFFAGSILLAVAALWLPARLLPEYSDWFIQTAYSLIDIVHLIIGALGLTITVGGLVKYFESFNEQQAEIEYRYQKLGILENLQHDAREPYQFLELLNLAVKEIASTLPECSGAVFLTGRNRKQFVLATSIGLNNEETGYLEYYPFGDNIVSQSVESSEPLLTSSFGFVDEKNITKESRFNSVMVLPLISGMDRIGAIVLFSTIERIFTHQDIRILAPVGEWLAEKIKSARATRELSAVRREKDEQAEFYSDAVTRIENASKVVNVQDNLNGFCSNLKGFADSETVNVVQSVNGTIEVLAGSDSTTEMGEPFMEAIASAIDRKKVSVINQNSEDEQGRTFTRTSTLVYPLNDLKDGYAILLGRQSIAFALNSVELKILAILAVMTSLAITKSVSEKSDLTRRLGFDKIVQLLRLPPRLTFKEDPGYMARHLASTLPTDTNVLTFVSAGSKLDLVDSFGALDRVDVSISIASDEGFVGNAFAKRNVVSVMGAKELSASIDELSESNRETFASLFESTSHPECAIAVPVMAGEAVEGVIVFLFNTLSQVERREWERMIILACGLYSLRMTVGTMREQKQKEKLSDDVGRITNAINNNLSAVIGNAEILMSRDGINNDIRSQIQSILNEAEVAAGEVRKLVQEKPHEDLERETLPSEISLNEVARQSLSRSHVSENLYMIAGHAREIELKLGEINDAVFPSLQMQELFLGAMDRFGSMADDDDVITVTTYKQDESVFLDISRHRRNFPPVESVAGFGNYQLPKDVLKARPADRYLEHLDDSLGSFAYDRFSNAPSYLSFKFPLRKSLDRHKTAEPIQILAVDDQPVILELISAMCQTLGYEVTTASSGKEALELSQDRKFRVILTDLAMPGMSGLELARNLKISHPETPIILITGWEATISEQELRESGITDILYKPFRIEQLTNLVKTAASGQSA